MKLHKALSALFSIVVLAATAAAESYYFATMTDFLGNKSFHVFTREELKTATDKMKLQNKFLPKVLQEIQKDFKANPDNHVGEKFWGNRLKAKTIKQKGPINSYEKAQNQLQRAQEREDNKDLEKTLGKGKKRLTEKEREKAFEEAQREQAIENFAYEVERIIKQKIEESAQ